MNSSRTKYNGSPIASAGERKNVVCVTRFRPRNVIFVTITRLEKNFSSVHFRSIFRQREVKYPMLRISKRFVVLLFLILLVTGAAIADDVAVFTNLGFSQNSRTFMFGQYGIHSGTPFAEIYTVDVSRNVFVASGNFSESYNVQISPGQSGIAALFSLLPEAQETISSYNINHFEQGRLIYLLVNGREPRSDLAFRDFDTGNRYAVSLVQERGGTEDSPKAAFYIDLSVEFANGTKNDFRVGRPGYFRDGVSGYRITQIFLSPDETSLVFVVEKAIHNSQGTSLRYMVETVKIR